MLEWKNNLNKISAVESQQVDEMKKYTNTMRVILVKEIQFLNNCLVSYIESDIFDSVDDEFFYSTFKIWSNTKKNCNSSMLLCLQRLNIK